MERHAPVEAERAASARGAEPHVRDGAAHGRRRHQRVGVDEDQPLAARGARAGVARLRDAAVLDLHHARAKIRGDGPGAIRGRVVDHDDLEP